MTNKPKFTAACLFLLFAALLSGCVTAPPTAKQLNRSLIQQIDKVEIFYHPEEHVAIHDFGQQSRSGVIGVGAFLGPVGIVAATAVAFAASNAALELAPERSRALNAAVKPAAQAQDMNREMAERLAGRLRQAGKTVKLSEVSRLPGVRPGMEPAVRSTRVTQVGGPTGSSGAGNNESREATSQKALARFPVIARTGYSLTPGFTPLLLRMTTGYGAPDVLATFRSIVIVEYALVNAVNGDYLTDGKLTSIDEPSGPTYLTWEQLLADVPKARAQMRTALLNAGDRVVPTVFTFESGR